jgi:hypothetical protein
LDEMPSTPLDYRTPNHPAPTRSISAAISIAASLIAVVVGFGAYGMIMSKPGPKTMFDGAAMGFVLFVFCAPLFLIAIVSAIVAARARAGRNTMLVIAWLFVAAQGVFWLVMMVSSIMNHATGSASHGAPGGF